MQGGVVVILQCTTREKVFKKSIYIYTVVKKKKHETLVTPKRLWFSVDGPSTAFARFPFTP